MKRRFTKISDLPLAASLPDDDEYVMPVCKDRTSAALNKISFQAMADRIKEIVLDGGEVEMMATKDGVKFKKLEELNQ